MFKRMSRVMSTGVSARMAVSVPGGNGACPAFPTGSLKTAGFRCFKGFEAGCLPWFQE